jgi:hypothetical protein
VRERERERERERSFIDNQEVIEGRRSRMKATVRPLLNATQVRADRQSRGYRMTRWVSLVYDLVILSFVAPSSSTHSLHDLQQSIMLQTPRDGTVSLH